MMVQVLETITITTTIDGVEHQEIITVDKALTADQVNIAISQAAVTLQGILAPLVNAPAPE
ncbi:MAG: hypothetical protein ACYDBB_21520 [Armatimonadota bacterium]